MATRYVRKSGSDSNGGTSPADAWLTIGKALGASGIASGDTVYIGAGVYRETVTVAMTSATVETFVSGDTDGSHTGDAGEVQWTAYTTNDKTAPSSLSCFDLAARDFLTFSGITFVSGTSLAIDASTNGYSTNITLRDCTLLGGKVSRLIDVKVAFGTASNWLIDRCRFLSYNQPITFTLGTSAAGGDYDAAFTIRNCLFVITQEGALLVSETGGLAKHGGGGVFENCTVFCAFEAVTVSAAAVSTTIPLIVRNCYINAGYGVNANVAGQLVEDYNLIVSGTPYGNVTPGAHSISDGSYAPLIHIGQELQYGATLRPFGMPTAGSPLLGFGGTAPSVDLLNAPRPAGGLSALTAVGAYERGNTFVKETGTVRSGSNAISITGPGYHDYRLRVNAVSTTVTVYVRWDATYSGTKPKLQVLHGTEAGVADATATAVGGSGSWEQIGLTFTPTAQGVVTIRFLSSDTNGGGKMFVDDLLSIP